jgi:hypothetical protein
VCFPSFEQLSEHHRSDFPNNWYQIIWFKVVFDFCSKIKVVKIMFWPYHCVEEKETKPLVKMAQNSEVGHARTRQHVPERRLPRAPTRHTRATRPLRSNGRPDPNQTAPWQRAKTPWRRCEGHDMSPISDRLMTTCEDTIEKVYGPRYEPSLECPRANVMVGYEWTGV